MNSTQVTQISWIFTLTLHKQMLIILTTKLVERCCMLLKRQSRSVHSNYNVFIFSILFYSRLSILRVYRLAISLKTFLSKLEFRKIHKSHVYCGISLYTVASCSCITGECPTISNFHWNYYMRFAVWCLYLSFNNIWKNALDVTFSGLWFN